MDDEPSSQQDHTMHTDPLSQSIVNNEFKLSQSIEIHSGALRCVATLPATNQLVSGSIDKTVKICGLNQQTGKYEFEREMAYHDGYVFALHPDVGGNGFYSASKDKKIMHVDMEGNPSKVFEGHENCVNSLSQSVPEEIVSGSWDGTARIWDT